LGSIHVDKYPKRINMNKYPRHIQLIDFGFYSCW